MILNMGIYRNHFASVANFAFVEGYKRTWTQEAPTVSDKLLISTNQTGERVFPVGGSASIEMLGDDCTDLNTPLVVSYSSDRVLGGFIINGRQIVAVPSGFDKVTFSDVDDMGIRLTLDDEEVVQSIDPTLGAHVLNGIGMVFCEKLIQDDNNANPDLPTRIKKSVGK